MAEQDQWIDHLKYLSENFGLSSKDNDFYLHKQSGKHLISRPGIDKIISRANIEMEITNITAASPTHVIVQVKATAYDSEGVGRVVHQLGSANEKTCKTAYFAEQAIARARSRAALSLTGLYERGFFGQAEFEDNEETKDTTTTSSSVVKGQYKRNS